MNKSNAFNSLRNNKPKIELISKFATKTSRGMLSKGWYKIDGKICLVKGNSVDRYGNEAYEPYSEVMATKIAEVLDFDHVPYWLMDAKLFPEVKCYSLGHVSVCENYITKEELSISFYEYIISKYNKEPKDFFEAYKEFLPSEPLFKMIVFDALIGNEDRHLNNIDVVIKTNSEEGLAPIYDNGASLLAWQQDYELGVAGSIGRLDKAKPFRTTHRSQIKLIDKAIVPYQEIDELYPKIVKAIDPILSFLSIKRRVAIKQFLKWRMKYIKKVMEDCND